MDETWGTLRRATSARDGSRLQAAAVDGGPRTTGARRAGQPPATVASATAPGPIHTAWLDSPLGPLLAAACDEGIVLLEFGEPDRADAQLAALCRLVGAPLGAGDHPLLRRLAHELAEYFAGTRRSFTLPLVDPGSDFQRRVWRALRDIPYGETCSYAALAAAVGHPRACRAVGNANRQNRIAILIPCHRVVNQDGRLGGYGGGIWRKKWLLALERGHPPLK
ncbi:O-6-methylguanine DNA methyltransferase [Fontimonas thermophila]|uniref:Methylated-DNA--protein-cysteine methyltransferase n=1 Tax=Fontimonas thermophila TaxID=1076937 RepID=A0A1I2GX93_9GAMM|nr:methylated-DNA--[protein]-cysteine S-methyltransferase [Fontimonas thermophila]SFF22564.1 O-6-methylguanine DNA methyltransferase [Fontimonas thermophila]